MFAFYLALVPIVTLYAMLQGWRSERPELTRCGGVILCHALVVQGWWFFADPSAWQGYPFVFMAVTLAIVLRIICCVPAGRGNAVLGGSVLFGILVSLVYGFHILFSGYSPHSDWNYGLAQFVMGWANLLILMGWTHEHSLGRVASSVLRAATRMVQSPRFGGVAR